MREHFAANEEGSRLRFHTQTGGATLTAQQPLNNVVRVAIQALAAVLGGTQSLHTNAYDEALALPTQASATLALRTQQVLAHETGVPEVVDPTGGSYYVESLTDTIERAARALVEEIESRGGASRAARTRNSRRWKRKNRSSLGSTASRTHRASLQSRRRTTRRSPPPRNGALPRRVARASRPRWSER
jgi:methylmalonyl-CoA mutase N-terminal domain/subunit